MISALLEEKRNRRTVLKRLRPGNPKADNQGPSEVETRIHTENMRTPVKAESRSEL